MKFCTFCGMGTGRLQLPFAVPFCGMTSSYGLMQKSGFAEKQFFRLRFFFAHRTGSFLCEVIVKGRRKETKKTTYWPYWQTQRLRKTSPLRSSSSQSSGVKTDALTIVPQDPCLRGPSYSLSELAAKGWGLVWRPCQRLLRHSGSSSLASNASRRLRRRLLRHSGRFPKSFLVASESHVRQ